jgi:hypothetical protein
MRSLFRALSFLLPALFALAAVLPAQADDDLRKQLAGLAKEIHKVVKDDPIAMGEFTGPAGANASGGTAIQRVLVEELQRQGVRIEKRAGMELKGDFGKAKNLDRKREEFKLTVQVLNAETRDIVSTLPGRYVADTDALIKLIGGTGRVDRFTNQDDYRNQIVKLIDNPSVFIDGSAIRSRQDSPFSVQVLARPRGTSGGRPRLAREIDGQAFVDADLGEEIVVVLTNNSRSEVAATLSLDGLDMFYFAEEVSPNTGRPYRHWVLGPGQSHRVEGWFHTLRDSRAFEIAPPGQGEATRVLGPAAKVGTITATFALTSQGAPVPVAGPPIASRPPAAPPPKAEAAPARPPLPAAPAQAPTAPGAPTVDAAPAAAPTAPAADARVEIGSGRRVASNASAPVARQIGPVIDFVSVRYQRPVNGVR